MNDAEMDDEHLFHILVEYDIKDYCLDNIDKILTLRKAGDFNLLYGLFAINGTRNVMLPGEKATYELFDYAGWRVHGLLPKSLFCINNL